MYVVAINRKAMVGYKKVTGKVERILPGRRRIGLFGRRDTGKSALISFAGDKYTGAVLDEVEEGQDISLFVFPDQAVYSAFPEGDVWDVDAGEVPEGRFLVKDAKGVKRAYFRKYGTLAAKLLGGAVLGAILWLGIAPVAGGAFFAAIAIQSLWSIFANGAVFRLYKTDTRKLSYSGRNTV